MEPLNTEKVCYFSMHMLFALPHYLYSQINKLHRADVESNLHFVGFLVFHCPLKPDAIDSLKMLSDSSHRVRQ